MMRPLLSPFLRLMPYNPLVQYHLGMTYAALERPERARTALENAIAIAGPDSTLPQMQRARDTLQSN